MMFRSIATHRKAAIGTAIVSMIRSGVYLIYKFWALAFPFAATGVIHGGIAVTLLYAGSSGLLLYAAPCCPEAG